MHNCCAICASLHFFFSFFFLFFFSCEKRGKSHKGSNGNAMNFTTCQSVVIYAFLKKHSKLRTYGPKREKTYLITCAPNEDSNQPAHPRSLIRVFAVRMTKLCILGYPTCAKWRFWSACANAQADLNLHWAHLSKGTFSDVAVHMSKWVTCPSNFLPKTRCYLEFHWLLALSIKIVLLREQN